MRRLLFILSFFILAPILSSAQVNEHVFWTAIFNTTKLNDKWSLQTDVHFRTSNEYKNLRSILVRPILLYNVSKNSSVGLGYALFDVFTHSAAPNTTEHRIYEQFIQKQNIQAVAITHRIRVEQRFTERPGTSELFTQRFRYYIRALIPLAKQKETTFNKGMYTAIQDELFFHMQINDQVNSSLFDQNRLGASIGYRFSPKFDMEFSYTSQHIKRISSTVSNSIAQLGVYTRF
ncbi:MAG: DUF2490 domain-containing protein [Mucilaginibacter sp.]